MAVDAIIPEEQLKVLPKDELLAIYDGMAPAPASMTPSVPQPT
jgi:hypothetical protein